MSEAKANMPREKSVAGLGIVLLLVALVAAYANHFHNSFHFDDAHTIENNAAIRELRNIPMFFRDATTFSSLPSNQSYRPLVSTLLAIDYSLGRRPAAVLVSLVDLRALRRARAPGRNRNRSPARRRSRDFTLAIGWIALAAAALLRIAPGKRGHGQLHHRIVGSDLDARRDRVVRGLLRLSRLRAVLSICYSSRDRDPG